MGKYKIDERDPTTFVISKLNGEKYTRITHKHTKRYGLSLDEYKERYNLSNVDLISEQVYEMLGFTKEKSINLYGRGIGVQRWEDYCKKQAKTNTFEYKKEKHGMSEDDFKKYNLSRSVTKDNLINRHGLDIGTLKWNNYCERQAHAGCSVEYFIEKYGDIKGVEVYKQLCKRKASTLDNFIIKYGVIEGTKRYNSRMEEMKPFYSQISQELFQKLDDIVWSTRDIYYAVNDNGEYGVYDDLNKQYYFYDYVNTYSKKCIEFHGDMFHGNPKIYSESDTPNVFNRSITCREMWEHDKVKIDCLKRLRGIDTLVVWESEYRNDMDGQYMKCVEFLSK